MRIGHLFRLPCGCKFRVEVFGVDEYARVVDHGLAYFCANHTRERKELNNSEGYEWDLNKGYYEDDAEALFWLDWKTAMLDDVLRRILVSPTPSPLGL